MTYAPIQGKCPVCHQDSTNSAFDAGAASRDAEIAELIAALERIGKYPRVRGDELGYEGCRAVANEALAKVRKP